MKPKIKSAEIESQKSEDENLEDGQKPLFSSLKSRSVSLIATLSIAFILLLFAIPGFFDNSAIKAKLQQKVSEITNVNFAINGDVAVTLLPYPAIIAKDVLLRNYTKEGKTYNLFAESFEIKLSLIDFLKGGFSVDKITLSNAVMETYYESNQAVIRDNKLQETLIRFPAPAAQSDENKDQKIPSSGSYDLFAVDKFQSSQFSATNLPTIEVKNGLMISYDKSSNKKEIEEINFKLLIDAEEIRASGKFSNDKISNSFKFLGHFNSDSSKNNSVIEINSPTINLSIKGSFTGENNGIFTSNFTGKIEAEIFELSAFYKDYISNNNIIFEKLKKNSKAIKIHSEIKNEQGEISLSNIEISSDLINGKGSAVIDLTSDILRLDVNLDLENLDLDNIWSKERVAVEGGNKNFDLPSEIDETAETIQQKKPEIASIDKNKNLAEASKDGKKPNTPTDKISEVLDIKIANKIKNIDLSAEIKIKDVKYLSDQITDLDLYLTASKDGQILVLPMIFKIPGKGTMRVSGALENKSNLPKFIGKLDISGENLGDTLKWLDLQSQNLKFDNLKNYIIYSDVMLLPNNIAMSNFYLNLNNGKSEFLGEISFDSSTKVSNITNRFQVSTFNVDDFFLTSGQNAYLSQGSLLKKLLWLNEIPSSYDMSLTFDKLIYKGEEFSNQPSIKLNFGQGYFKITDLKIKSSKTNFQGSMSVDLSNENPEFTINIIADNLHYEASQNKPSLFQKNPSKFSIADQFFALPSLEGFEGNLNFVVNSLDLEDLTINNIKIGGKLKDGNISIADSTCDIYGGNMKYKGLIGIKDYKTINGNLTLKNALLEMLLPNLTQIKNIKGIANISANITSITDSKERFLKETNSEIKFSASTPEVAGYGLSDLVSKMFYVNNFRQELQDPEKILLNPNSKTVFKQASGSITAAKNKGGKFSIKLVAPAINGILSGKFDISKNSIDGLANIIFITGSKQKQIPINIATALKGNMKEITASNNLDQVKQYLGILKSKPAENKTLLLNPQNNSVIINKSDKAINQNDAATQNQQDQKAQALEKIKAAATDPNSILKQNNLDANQPIKP